MGNLDGFDPSAVPADEYTVLPAGDYVGCIISSEKKHTKSGTGAYVNLTIEIIDGPHSGRRVFDLINLWNANPKAVEIAQRTLASICAATGVVKPTDTSDLHNIPIGLKLGVSPDDGWGEKNKVKKYYAVGGSVGEAPAAPAPPAPAGPAWKTQRR
jgi:hypothetical protein